MSHPLLTDFPNLPTFKTPQPKVGIDEWSTDFHIVLEPVLYGFIPESSLRDVRIIGIIAVIGLALSPFIIWFLELWVSAKIMDPAVVSGVALREKSE